MDQTLYLEASYPQKQPFLSWLVMLGSFDFEHSCMS